MWMHVIRMREDVIVFHCYTEYRYNWVQTSETDWLIDVLLFTVGGLSDWRPLIHRLNDSVACYSTWLAAGTGRQTADHRRYCSGGRGSWPTKWMGQPQSFPLILSISLCLDCRQYTRHFFISDGLFICKQCQYLWGYHFKEWKQLDWGKNLINRVFL